MQVLADTCEWNGMFFALATCLRACLLCPAQAGGRRQRSVLIYVNQHPIR
jgi:hypothetical protein